MRSWILVLLVFAGCGGPAADQSADDTSPVREVVGSIESKRLDESSGLARSHRDPGLFWSMNDDGPAEIFALGPNGEKRGRVEVNDAKNTDWEDLASFELDGTPYLLIAAIGDNEKRRKNRRIYVIKEPKPDRKKVSLAWVIEFTYPDGPRDAESVAVDTENERILVLSKRDLPPVLYELPLRPESRDVIEAKRLGPVETLRKPSASDVSNASLTRDWYWQPTAMDISPDNRFAIILTYASVYFFERHGQEDWYATLSRPPLAVSLGRLRNAEAIAITADGTATLLTTEGRHSPIVKVDLQSVLPPRTADVNELSIMSFNVQNLFDNHDDPGKDDKAYLPIAAKQSDTHKAACATIEVESWRNECLYLDWSDETIDLKLSVLADAIVQVDDGRGADIIAFQEVENIGILEQLRQRLDGLGYLPAILIERDDARGIDVAFLSRLPVVGEPALRQASFDRFPDRAGDTRAVLEATFELPDGSLLTGFAVHFPAPFHPTEMREVAYEHLAMLRNALPDDRHAFAAGDFNTTSTEDVDQKMLDRFVRPVWDIAHESGCDGCLGTYYYARDDNWSFLDMILFSAGSGAETTWRIRADSAWVGNRTEAQVSLEGTPQRFVAHENLGVSDHWPLVVTIESN